MLSPSPSPRLASGCRFFLFLWVLVSGLRYFSCISGVLGSLSCWISSALSFDYWESVGRYFIFPVVLCRGFWWTCDMEATRTRKSTVASYLAACFLFFLFFFFLFFSFWHCVCCWGWTASFREFALYGGMGRKCGIGDLLCVISADYGKWVITVSVWTWWRQSKCVGAMG